MLLDGLIKPVTELVSNIVKRILPAEKISEEERLRIISQIQLELMRADWSTVQKQADVVMSEAEGRSWLQRNWRPILMLTIVAIVANNYLIYPYLSMFTDKAKVLMLPDKLWNLMTIGVGGYIVGRSGEKIMDRWKKGG